MIYYDNQSWFQLIFAFRGTVWENTWHLVLLILVCSFVVYEFEAETNLQLGCAGHTIFGSTMSYLLVFRANNAYMRYIDGRGLVTRLFLGLREYVGTLCVLMRGGAANELWRTGEERPSKFERESLEDANDIYASMARVNVVRWAVSLAISIKLHTRLSYPGFEVGKLSAEEKWKVDYDRLRLRGLMTRQEFEDFNDLIPMHEEHLTKGKSVLTQQFLEEALEPPDPNSEREYLVDTTPDMRQPVGVIYKLMLEITRHMNESWGFKERFAKPIMLICQEASDLFENICVIITTPIPFPYVNLCKVLLMCFLISSPLVIQSSLGFFANVVLPTVVAMSLLGIDAIASELENPFGDDLNDLDIVRLINQLEAECLMFLELTGDFRALDSFRLQEIPPSLLSEDPRHAGTFLCLASQLQQQTPVSSPETSFASFEKTASGKQARKARKAEGSLRASFADDDEDDDPSRPLLGPGEAGGGAGKIAGGEEVQMGERRTSSKLKRGETAGVFQPIEEFGTQTVFLADEAQDAIVDVEAVGIDEYEEEQEEARRAAEAGEAPPLPPPPMPPAEAKRESKQMKRGETGGLFKPMDEFGTETVELKEHDSEGEDGGVDVVGLDDDEEADGAGGGLEGGVPADAKASNTSNLLSGFQPMAFASGSMMD